jgi:hypothetical protein
LKYRKQTQPRQFLRCPVCGKLSVEDRYGIAHPLDLLIQSFVGGGNRGWVGDTTKKERREEREREGVKGGGFQWTREGYDRGMVVQMAQHARAAAERLERLTVALDGIAEGNDPEEVLGTIADAAARDAREQDGTIDRRALIEELATDVNKVLGF